MLKTLLNAREKSLAFLFTFTSNHIPMKKLLLLGLFLISFGAIAQPSTSPNQVIEIGKLQNIYNQLSSGITTTSSVNSSTITAMKQGVDTLNQTDRGVKKGIDTLNQNARSVRTILNGTTATSANQTTEISTLTTISNTLNTISSTLTTVKLNTDTLARIGTVYRLLLGPTAGTNAAVANGVICDTSSFLLPTGEWELVNIYSNQNSNNFLAIELITFTTTSTITYTLGQIMTHSTVANNYIGNYVLNLQATSGFATNGRIYIMPVAVRNLNPVFYKNRVRYIVTDPPGSSPTSGQLFNISIVFIRRH